MSKSNVNVDKESWNKIRDMLGGRKITDRRRSMIIKDILEEVDIKRKLNPELSDSPSDRIMKKINRRFI